MLAKLKRPSSFSLHTLTFTAIVLFSFFLSGCTLPHPIQYKFDSQYPVADPQFPYTVGNLLGPPLIPGNTITTLLNGDQIYPDMLKAVQGAQKTITFETYVYWKGAIGHQFALAFAERASQGVRVHVLIDDIGSDKIDSKDIALMKEAGVQLYKYHPFHLYDPYSWTQIDHRTHRKILVVDGKVGWTGGVGLADIWLGNAQDKEHWRDNHYRIEGPVVAQLQSAFVDNWNQTAGVVLDGPDYFPRLEPTGSHFAQVFKSSPEGGSENMQLLFLYSIAHAAKSIRIESAYFVPDKRTRAALIAAAQRGVNVEIIVPGRHTDIPVVRSASRASWGDMLKVGEECERKGKGSLAIYEFQPTMIHCKVIIVDDLWSSVGSSNIDNRSFRINDEANLNVYDHDFANLQTRVFEEDKSRSKRITYEYWKDRPLYEKLTAPISNLFKTEL